MLQLVGLSDDNLGPSLWIEVFFVLLYSSEQAVSRSTHRLYGCLIIVKLLSSGLNDETDTTRILAVGNADDSDF